MRSGSIEAGVGEAAADETAEEVAVAVAGAGAGAGAAAAESMDANSSSLSSASLRFCSSLGRTTSRLLIT